MRPATLADLSAQVRPDVNPGNLVAQDMADDALDTAIHEMRETYINPDALGTDRDAIYREGWSRTMLVAELAIRNAQGLVAALAALRGISDDFPQMTKARELACFIVIVATPELSAAINKKKDVTS